MNKLTIIFFGSPYYSVPLLKKIISLDHYVPIVVSQGSQKTRRGKIVRTAVNEFCNDQKIKCVTPEDFDKDFVNLIDNYNPDLGFIYSYGKILPNNIIDIFKFGIMNLHCSLLPSYKGAAPIQHSLINDEDITGITYFSISDKLDEGKIILSEKYKIIETDNCRSIQDKLTDLAIDRCESSIERMVSQKFISAEPNITASYAKKINKTDSIINWEMDARQIFNNIRALHVWPITSISLCNQEIKVLEASCELIKHSYQPGRIVKFNKNELVISARGGLLSILRLQFDGKKPISNKDLFNSHHPLRETFLNDCAKI